MGKLRLLDGAGILTLILAALHLGCIIFGAEWYRILGAGEQMAQLAERGDPYPTIITSTIIFLLLIWSCYAFSGAGRFFKLPLLRTGLSLIAIVLLTRALGFYFLTSAFPDNSLTFWLISSGLCFILGSVYALGLKQSWQYLSKQSQ